MTTPVHIIQGCCLGIVISEIYQVPLEFSIPIALISCLLYDVNSLIIPISKHHSDFTHYPIIINAFIFFAFILGVLPQWILITALFGANIHFLLDTFGMTIGIYWLYPFNKREYSFTSLVKPEHELSTKERVNFYISRKFYIIELLTCFLLITITRIVLI